MGLQSVAPPPTRGWGTEPAGSADSPGPGDHPTPLGGDPRTSDLQAAFLRALPTPEWPQAARDRIVVALVDLREWRGWLADAAALIDPAETARVARRRFPADREALVLSYALHRLLLGSALGLDAADVPLGRDQHGCPRLAGSPQHLPDAALPGHGRSASATCTSLSHSGDFAAFAFTATGPVGVDIEPASSTAAMAGIAERICTVEETETLRALSGPARSAALLALWVRKEALLKAAGIGLACEMIDFCAPAGRKLPLPTGDGHAEGGGVAEIRMLDVGEACVAAVAGAPAAGMNSGWLHPRP